MSICTQPITIVALQRGTSLPNEDKSPEALPEVRGTLNAKKATRNGSLFVRTKGLEPPRLSASDPKSDVATNYTMSAGILANSTPQPGDFSGAKI